MIWYDYYETVDDSDFHILRSSFTQQLLVPSYRLSTVGRRSFPVAASMFWNTLPDDVQSAPSLSVFRRLLKTFLFQHSFPDVIL